MNAAYIRLLPSDVESADYGAAINKRDNCASDRFISAIAIAAIIVLIYSARTAITLAIISMLSVRAHSDTRPRRQKAHGALAVLVFSPLPPRAMHDPPP